jgi:hypothetical protein
VGGDGDQADVRARVLIDGVLPRGRCRVGQEDGEAQDEHERDDEQREQPGVHLGRIS